LKMKTINDEPETMKELHRIREKLYEEMKDLPISEQGKLMRDKAERFMKEHGLKLETPLKVD
jgi:hypothetical protein